MGWYNLAVAAVSIVTSAADAIGKASRSKAAAQRAEDAMARLAQQREQLANLDTSNPYLNMENTMEDLTINQQAVEYERSQMLQSQSNIMERFRETAGSSGIAALAQSLAQSGQLAAQKTAASIGDQEAKNNLLRAQEGSKIQGLERQGEMMSRQMQFGLLESQMGMNLQEASMERNLEYGLSGQANESTQSFVSGSGDFMQILDEGGYLGEGG